MYIQGDLQAVFDALYMVGVIDPVLKMDWETLVNEMNKNPGKVANLFHIVNDCRGNRNALVHQFESMDEKSLYYIAMEVAREFSDFYERKTLH